VTAEIRRGKERKIETTGQKYNGLPYSIAECRNVVIMKCYLTGKEKSQYKNNTKITSGASISPNQ